MAEKKQNVTNIFAQDNIGLSINLMISAQLNTNLKENPEEICKDSVSAAPYPLHIAIATLLLLLLKVVEHVRDPAGECQHDDKESCKKHHHILHHGVDA